MIYLFARNSDLYCNGDLLSGNALSANPHSGDGKRVAGNIVVWAERTPIGDGTPCWAADLQSGERWFLGMADPAREGNHKPDVHCQPQVWQDDDDHIHILLGSHHGRLLYARSIAAGTLADGWTDWREIGHAPLKPQWGYTYPTLHVEGDTIHIVARWTGRTEQFDWDLVHFTYNTKTGETSEHRTIDTAPTTARYAVFYQRLSVIEGRLRVNYQLHHGESGQTAKPEPPKNWEVEL